MIEMTSDEYYGFLEDILDKYEAGNLSEEEARQMINNVDVSEYKADPRPIADIPTEWSSMVAAPVVITNKSK
jgi:hypothetical protein